MTQCERHIEFVVKVKQMRTAQKQYFISRDRQWLAEAKRLETEVDGMLSDELMEINKGAGNAQHS